MEEIFVNVDMEANVTVEAKGVKGQGCAALTRAIEGAIGKSVADQKKPEFFQQAPATQGQSQ